MASVGWPLIRVFGPKFWDTVYISEVNEAKEVKSDSLVAMKKEFKLFENFFRRGWLGDSDFKNFSKLLELPETSQARKPMFWLQINIDKAKSSRYDVVPGTWCRGRSAPTINFSTPCLSLKLFEQVSSHSE